MELLWGVILTLMLTIFIILDGADFGAGIIHLFVAKNEEDKERIIKSIGPFWDGNEVWLIAAGGVLFFAFPILYASAFSGFYLPLMMVLWLLIFRAIGLEFRNQVNNSLWKVFWDKAFGISSLLLALFFGAALGNVVRGVNLGGVENGVAKFESIYFFNPLWNESFSPLHTHPGILDWFTVILGLIAVVVLTIHGANWIIFKTNSGIRNQLKQLVYRLTLILIPLLLISVFAWILVRPDALDNFYLHPGLWVFPLMAITGIAGLLRINHFKSDIPAFLFSSLFIFGAFLSTMSALFPQMLPSTNDMNPGLTLYNATASEYGLTVGLYWWLIAIILVSIYFYYVHRIFRGKMDDVDYH